MPDDFLSAVLAGRKLSQERTGLAKEIEQRALDRMLREREMNAQIENQKFLQKLQAKQAGLQQSQFDFTKQQAEEEARRRAAEGIAKGIFLPGQAQQYTVPSGVPGLPALEGTLPAPPGQQFNFGGVPVVPASPDLQMARAIQMKEAEAQADARGKATAFKLHSEQLKTALDEFDKAHPDVFKNDPDLKTDMYLWSVTGQQPRDESMYAVLGRAFKTIANPNASKEQRSGANAIINAFSGTRAPQASPAFNRDVTADDLAGEVYRSVIAKYQDKDGKVKLPPGVDLMKEITASAATNPKIPAGFLPEITKRARYTLISEHPDLIQQLTQR